MMKVTLSLVKNLSGSVLFIARIEWDSKYIKRVGQ